MWSNRLWPQVLSSTAFLLILANSCHVLLLKQHQDAPELLVGRLAGAFVLAMVCRNLAHRSGSERRATLDRLWLTVGRPELVLLGFLFILLLLFHVSYMRAGGDGREYFVQVHSLVIDGDLRFENDPPFGARRPEIFPLGTAILWTPFFVAGHLWLGVLNLFGEDFVRDGSRNPYQMAIGLGTLTYGFIGVILIYRIARDYFSDLVALCSTLGISAGSFVVYYLAVEPSYSHGNSLFAVTLFLFIFHRTRERRTSAQWGALGLAGGLLTMVRWQNAIFVAIPILDMAPAYWAALRHRRVQELTAIAKTHGLFIVGGVVGFFPQLYLWKVANGGWLAVPHAQTGQQWWQDSLMIDVLYSSNHGLLTWHPVIYAAVLAIPLFLKRDLRFGVLLTLVFASQIYINGATDDWWGGSAFGARRFASCGLLFVLGLGALITWLQARPFVAVTAVIGPLVALNVVLVAGVMNGRLPSGEGITFDRMIERLGNPFAFPANAVFVWRHGGSVVTYDQLGQRLFDNLRIDVGGPEDERFLGTGWSGREQNEVISFRWAQNLESVVIVPLAGPRVIGPDEPQRLADYVLRFRAAPFRFPDSPTQEIDIAVNRQPVARLSLDRNLTIYEVDVPHYLLKRNLNEIRFRYNYATSPQDVGQSDDSRPLSVLFDQIDFVQR